MLYQHYDFELESDTTSCTMSLCYFIILLLLLRNLTHLKGIGKKVVRQDFLYQFDQSYTELL